MVLQRWPITQIVAVNVAASAGFPTQWTAVPDGYWRIERPPMGLYGTNAPSGAGEGGQAVLIAPSYVNWCNGRNGLRVQVQYLHGWPHAGLTTPGHRRHLVARGGRLHRLGARASNSAANSTRARPGSSTTAPARKPSPAPPPRRQPGPGTLTLASPTTYAHNAGVMVSALPANVIWSSALFTGADALTRGATTTTVRSLPGHAGGACGADELRIDAELKLRPYRVTV